jgi:phosphoribosylglycinamide formyltransferase-1
VSEGKEFKLAILGSGQGSNMVAIAEACRAGRVPGEVAIVLSDAAGAGILTRAAERGIRAKFIPPGKFRTKLDEEAEAAYIAALQQAQVDLIVLAGFMRILKGDFLRAFPERVVNIHPALLPSFPGLEAWKQALDYGVKVTGCSVHLVDAGTDTGPLLAQESVPVLDDDDEATLHERIKVVERRLLVEVLAAVAVRGVTWTGRKATIG